MELLVLALVFLSPWAFGAVDPRWEFWLYVGIANALLLWALRLLNDFQFRWQHCPVAYALAGMLLLASWQLVPMPREVLAIISPATAHLYDRLLPEQREQVFGEPEKKGLSSDSTISVYKFATRRHCVHLLAILLVYTLVRNNLAGPAFLRRFCIGGLLCGTALAFFSLMQFFTSPPSLIYWSFSMENTVFGPFICRNHFPFYVNLCFGLGLGLLCSQLSGRRGEKQEDGKDHLACEQSGHFASYIDLLHKPQVLWMIMALVLMATSIVFSLSRGGILAFLGGGLLCLLVFFKRSARFSYVASSFIILIGSLALLTWFGLDRVQTRFQAFFQDQLGQDARVSLLMRAPMLIKDFPVWGSGYGTLDFVEPIYRDDASNYGWSYEHAHNEYLEEQLEGGLFGLILTVLVVGLVFRQSLEACRLWEGTPSEWLVLGGLFGITTLVLHNFVDFGMHLPAVTLLAVVLCAHLSAMSDVITPKTNSAKIRERHFAPRQSLVWRGLLPVGGAMALTCLAVFLWCEGYRGAEIRSLQRTASDLKDSKELADQETGINVLEEALRLNPSNARLEFEVGERYAALFEALAQKASEREILLQGIQAVLLLNPVCTPASGDTGRASFLFLAKLHHERRKRIVADLIPRLVTPALGHFLSARDHCPARAKVHMEIAYYQEYLKKAEPRSNYLDRALYLDPTNPGLWYRAGILAVRDGRLDQAANYWRRSLQLSDDFLSKIVQRSIGRFNSQDLIDHVLPDNPGSLLVAVTQIYPKIDAPERRPFVVKARRLYEDALKEKPFNAEWRFELAKLLFEQHQFQEARQELLTVLAVRPGYVRALELLSRTERQILNGQSRRAIDARHQLP